MDYVETEKNGGQQLEAYTGFAAVYDIFMDNVPYEEWGEYIHSLLKDCECIRPTLRKVHYPWKCRRPPQTLYKLPTVDLRSFLFLHNPLYFTTFFSSWHHTFLYSCVFLHFLLLLVKPFFISRILKFLLIFQFYYVLKSTIFYENFIFVTYFHNIFTFYSFF